jgi:LmbE family N-acetylglucosaminyl deacetylase
MTSEAAWTAALAGVASWTPNYPDYKDAVVLAPHPDDETLGAGGLIATLRTLGVDVSVLAVTDGEAAYPDNFGLGEIRRQEQEQALYELGVERWKITRLRLPDSAVSQHEEQLVALIQPQVGEHTLLVAPWEFDPHPDHEATGRAAERVATLVGAKLISYVFWTWRWKDVEALAEVPLVRLELDERAQAARSAALAKHKTQLEHVSGSPILTDELLAPTRRPFETFVLHE